MEMEEGDEMEMEEGDEMEMEMEEGDEDEEWVKWIKKEWFYLN
jgi:hypothetical protein